MEVKLGAVKGAVALVYDVALAHMLYSLLEGIGGKIPGFLIADMILRHGANFDLIGQAEGGVNFVKQTNDVLYLMLHLVPGHEDVGIVLSEAADAE